MGNNTRTLNAKSALGGFERRWPEFFLSEISGGEILSISALGKSCAQLSTVFDRKFGVELPAAGKAVEIENGFVFWTAPRQWFLSTEGQDVFSDMKLQSQFGDLASVTLQSDAWAQIELSGKQVYNVLERLIALDIAGDVFVPGTAVRTQAAHVNIMLLRLSNENSSFRMLCARSYSQSLSGSLTRSATSLFGMPIDK